MQDTFLKAPNLTTTKIKLNTKIEVTSEGKEKEGSVLARRSLSLHIKYVANMVAMPLYAIIGST